MVFVTIETFEHNYRVSGLGIELNIIVFSLFYFLSFVDHFYIHTALNIYV